MKSKTDLEKEIDDLKTEIAALMLRIAVLENNSQPAWYPNIQQPLYKEEYDGNRFKVWCMT